MTWLEEIVDTFKKAGKISDKWKISGSKVDAVYFHMVYSISSLPQYHSGHSEEG